MSCAGAACPRSTAPPVVQMGLLLDASGIPLDDGVFTGNQNDMTTLLPMMRKGGLCPERGTDGAERDPVIVVADKGLDTSDNIAACTFDRNGYIFSQSVYKATRGAQNVGTRRRRLLGKRQRGVQGQEQTLRKDRPREGRGRQNAFRQGVREEGGEQEMGDRDVIEAYRGFWRIEESFRVLKGNLEAQPVYASCEEHIRAHFLVCYIALLVMRLMQLDTGCKHTPSEIVSALSDTVGHHVDSNVWFFDYRTDLTDKLTGTFGVDLSRQAMRKSQITKVTSTVQRPRS